LRHLTVQLPTRFEDNLLVLSFLIRLLSTSSSTSGIETLSLKIPWCDVDDADEILDIFTTFDSEWAILDQVLTSEKFVSLRKVVLDRVIEVTSDDAVLGRGLHNSALDRLFPKLRRRCILETPLEITCPFHDN